MVPPPMHHARHSDLNVCRPPLPSHLENDLEKNGEHAGADPAWSAHRPQGQHPAMMPCPDGLDHPPPDDGCCTSTSLSNPRQDTAVSWADIWPFQPESSHGRFQNSASPTTTRLGGWFAAMAKQGCWHSRFIGLSTARICLWMLAFPRKSRRYTPSLVATDHVEAGLPTSRKGDSAVRKDTWRCCDHNVDQSFGSQKPQARWVDRASLVSGAFATVAIIHLHHQRIESTPADDANVARGGNLRHSISTTSLLDISPSWPYLARYGVLLVLYSSMGLIALRRPPHFWVDFAHAGLIITAIVAVWRASLVVALDGVILSGFLSLVCARIFDSVLARHRYCQV
ncbi:hypothetical protein VTJ83DRAFT_7509 [Remersonia thermophila]|uniref:Uncharacterized protein n=1 Tax=Remersonia thermophila TaxID=72144 RepID=A0ABR4D3N8_9PEZI